MPTRSIIIMSWELILYIRPNETYLIFKCVTLGFFASMKSSKCDKKVVLLQKTI